MATFIVYFPAIRGGEIWDDAPNVTQNPLLHNVRGLAEMWTNFRSMPAYYPVTHTSWWIDYQLFGLDLRFYHIENIAMHAVSSVLIWLALRRLSVPGAWLAAALWALHPIHVESVAWITERKNTLSVLLYLISFHCYVRASGMRRGGWGFRVQGSEKEPGLNPEPRTLNPRWYIASLFFFAIALPAKTPVVTLPAAILLAWWYLRGGEPHFWPATFRRELVRMIPFFVLGLCMGVATVLIEQHHTGAKGPLFTFSPLQRLVLIGRSFWFYAWKVIWPANFNFIYPRWNIPQGVTIQILFPLAALGLMLALICLRKKIGRGPAAAILFFAGTALPALGIAPIFFHRYSLVSDHFAYLCNLGILVLVAYAIVRLLRSQPIALYAVAGIALVGVSIQSIKQTFLYKDNFTMWSDVLQKNPSAWLARGNLAREMHALGRHEKEGQLLAEEYKAAPDEVEVALGYANYLATHGHFAESPPFFERAIELKPDYLNTYGFYGRALSSNGRTDDAIKLYQDTLAKHPEWEAGWIDLAEIFEQIGKPERAADLYAKAIAANPQTVGARVNLANLYLKVGNLQRALNLLNEAATLANDDPDIHNRYGLVLLQIGQYPAAIEQFQRMVDLTRGKEGSHIAYHNLATALEGAGRNSEAVLNYRRALQIKPDFAPAQRNLERALRKSQ
ncbi:MAG TPA: tetratricopeptide repeat protein [Tepidisphaeraceae bacterium]|nr:tetratricopeptide repeat protein [Tepidisphaeraceae bacterium]